MCCCAIFACVALHLADLHHCVSREGRMKFLKKILLAVAVFRDQAGVFRYRLISTDGFNDSCKATLHRKTRPETPKAISVLGIIHLENSKSSSVKPL